MITQKNCSEFPRRHILLQCTTLIIFPSFTVYQFKSVVLNLYKPPNTYLFLQACFERELVVQY